MTQIFINAADPGLETVLETLDRLKSRLDKKHQQCIMQGNFL